MIKVEIEKLEDFLKKIGWHILIIGERKKGQYVYATKEDYSNSTKPMGIEVLMIELV